MTRDGDALNELRDELKRLQQQYDRTAMEMKRRLDDKELKAREIKEAFMDFKREILKGAENSRTGKPIPPKLIKSFEEGDRERDDEVEKLRLTNINRRNVLRKLEQTLRQKEKLADGLHLIDFDEPFGYSVVEAMACGTPVVAHNRGSMTEIIDHATTGFVVENAEEAVQAIELVGDLDRPAIRGAVLDRFSAETMVTKYVALYRSVLNGRAREAMEG